MIPPVDRDGASTDPEVASWRVLWLTENHPPSRGGMAQSSDRIVRGLRRAGVDVDVAHFTRASLPWRHETVEGGHVRVCPVEDDPEHALRRLWTDLAAGAPGDVAPAPAGRQRGRHVTHVVAFGGTLPMLAGPIYARWLDAPLVTLLRGNDFDTGIFSVRRQSLLLDALAASVHVCVVASGNVPLVGALTTTPVSFIANGIEVRDWNALPSERERADRWRAEHVEPGRRTLGLIGQLKRKKGVLFLLEALEHTPALDQLHLVLVGDVEAPVLHWLDAHATTVAFTHLPFLDRFELLGLFPACDVVALPSFYDGLPNVALEAAALGIPLLCSDAGGLADLIVDGEHGFVFRAGNTSACREALHRLGRTGDEALQAMGDAARARVLSDFTHEHETAAYLQVLRATQPVR